MRKMLIAVAALLAAPAMADELAPPPMRVTPDCLPPEGWAAVTARDPDFVVFGELHGTNEAPAVVARLLCAEAARGQRLLLAVEHSSWQNPA